MRARLVVRARLGWARSLLVTTTLILAGCASMFVHGGRLVGRRYSTATQIALYQLGACVDASGAPSLRPDATYHLLVGTPTPELFERGPDGSGVVVTNRWQDSQGTHYFAWGAGLGWEYVIPADGSPGRRLGHRGPSSTTASDGTRRPLVSRPPESTCELVLVQGTPPSVASAPPSVGAPTGAETQWPPVATRALRPLRIELEWTADVDLDLVVVGRDFTPVAAAETTARPGRTTSGPSTAARRAEWIDWEDTLEEHLILCAMGNAGAGVDVTCRVTFDGRVAERRTRLEGTLGRPCTLRSRGFLVDLNLPPPRPGSPSPPPPTVRTEPVAPPSPPADGGSGACAAGRIETADGHCCFPGQEWDTARRECAASTQCAGGRVPTSDGHCCWPAQTFDTQLRVCTGPPRCPPGLGAAGEDCIAP